MVRRLHRHRRQRRRQRHLLRRDPRLPARADPEPGRVGRAPGWAVKPIAVGYPEAAAHQVVPRAARTWCFPLLEARRGREPRTGRPARAVGPGAVVGGRGRVVGVAVGPGAVGPGAVVGGRERVVGVAAGPGAVVRVAVGPVAVVGGRERVVGVAVVRAAAGPGAVVRAAAGPEAGRGPRTDRRPGERAVAARPDPPGQAAAGQCCQARRSLISSDVPGAVSPSEQGTRGMHHPPLDHRYLQSHRYAHLCPGHIGAAG